MDYYQAKGSDGQPVRSKVAVHPGEILEDELRERGLKKNYVAQQLGLKPSNLSEIVKGRRGINAELAYQLEQTLNIEAEFWLRSQMRYDLTVVRNKYHLAS